MMVIEIETGKKKRIRAAEFIGQWLTDGKEKYKKIEKSIDKQPKECYNTSVKRGSSYEKDFKKS